MKKLILLCLIFVLTLGLLSCTKTTPPEKIADIPDIERGYFGELTAPISIDLTDYISKNDCEVTYAVSSSNDAVVSATVTEDILTLSLKATDKADITVSVVSEEKEAFALSFSVSGKAYTKIACVGDSLTYGHLWNEESYPVYLAEMLDGICEVKNFGLNGAAVTSYGPAGPEYKYELLTQYSDSLAYEADIVVILLGSNDAFGWDEAKDTYVEEYRKLIRSYKENDPDVQILFVTSSPFSDDNPYGLSDTNIREYLYPTQLAIAEAEDLPLLDFHAYMTSLEGGFEALLREDEGLHLSVSGAQQLATLVLEALLATY